MARTTKNGTAKKEERKYHATYEVFSPRWGHTDTYHVTMTPKEMRFEMGGTKHAQCKFKKDEGHIWTGHAGSDNPLMNIFSDDEIYAPSIVPFALEWAWNKWRNGETTDDKLHDGLKELFNWISDTARSMPTPDLFQGAY